LWSITTKKGANINKKTAENAIFHQFYGFKILDKLLHDFASLDKFSRLWEVTSTGNQLIVLFK